MEQNPPSPAPSWSLVAKSWQLLKRFSVGAIYLYALPSLLSGLAIIYLQDQVKTGGRFPLTGFVLLAVALLWGIGNQAASLYYRAAGAEGEQPTVREAYSKTWRRIGRLYGFYALLSLAVLAGLVLFIVPGLIVLSLYVKRYYFADYYIAHRGFSIRQAMQVCRDDTQPYFRNIIGLLGVQLAITIAGSLVPTIQGSYAGGLIAGLLVWFMPALRYIELSRVRR